MKCYALEKTLNYCYLAQIGQRECKGTCDLAMSGIEEEEEE
jgi:hypothetical protein